MSRMAPLSEKKRKIQDGMRGKTERPKKRIRKQKEYHSSSEDSDMEEDEGFAPVNLNDSDEEAVNPASGKRTRIGPQDLPSLRKIPTDVQSNDDPETSGSGEDDSNESDEEEDGDDDDREEQSHNKGAPKGKSTSKRNDPEAFSTSISKILSTKLSQSARRDPVLSRSREAVEASSSIANERLEKKAKAKLRAERKQDQEKGRIRDALGLQTGQAGEVAEEEKRLRKIAQRGVVKLFNAVRAAQVRGEQAAREERKKGTVGMANREEKANEMSKQGFLELINGKK